MTRFLIVIKMPKTLMKSNWGQVYTLHKRLYYRSATVKGRWLWPDKAMIEGSSLLQEKKPCLTQEASAWPCRQAGAGEGEKQSGLRQRSCSSPA